MTKKENYISILLTRLIFRLIKYKVENNNRKFYDLLSSYGFLPMNLLPTRVMETASTIITNNLDNIVNAEAKLVHFPSCPGFPNKK